VKHHIGPLKHHDTHFSIKLRITSFINLRLEEICSFKIKNKPQSHKKSNGLRVADKKSQPPRHEVIRAAEVKNCFEPLIARIYTDKKSEKITGLVRCANAGFVVEKTLASGLADAFLQHIPACRPSATPHFLPKIS
jgi:hypothetical protein